MITHRIPSAVSLPRSEEPERKSSDRKPVRGTHVVFSLHNVCCPSMHRHFEHMSVEPWDSSLTLNNTGCHAFPVVVYHGATPSLICLLTKPPYPITYTHNRFLGRHGATPVHGSCRDDGTTTTGATDSSPSVITAVSISPGWPEPTPHQPRPERPSNRHFKTPISHSNAFLRYATSQAAAFDLAFGNT